MAASSTTPPLDWLVGFRRNINRIGQIGMDFGNFDTLGMMGMLRGNFTCREDGVRLWKR